MNVYIIRIMKYIKKFLNFVNIEKMLDFSKKNVIIHTDMQM